MYMYTCTVHALYVLKYLKYILQIFLFEKKKQIFGVFEFEIFSIIYIYAVAASKFFSSKASVEIALKKMVKYDMIPETKETPNLFLSFNFKMCLS